MIIKYTIRYFRVGVCTLACCGLWSCQEAASNKVSHSLPNIILIMADDMGWGDAGFMGNEVIQTPALDAMAEEGVVFNRFYAAAPVCSPTRGSCLTGRHPFRYGVYHANVGKLKDEEYGLAELAKDHNYTTGHFGKWHLGTLTHEKGDGNRSGDTTVYAPPWEHGFDKCFSTESKVPTWDPMLTPPTEICYEGRKNPPGEPFGTYYWNENGEKVRTNLEGDDSRIIMDRAIPFIENAHQSNQPFLAVIWFHSPHLPVIAGPKYRELYQDNSVQEQHYYGSITAMDDQVGRLRKALDGLGISNNTLIFFTSDNGPEGGIKDGCTQGTAAILKGRKRSLYEGGIRVPGIAVWPDMIKSPIVSSMPVVTSDYLPTVMDILNYDMPDAYPLDGISLLPLFRGEQQERPTPIGFQSGKQQAFIGQRHKLYSLDQGKTFELYDLIEDPSETEDLSVQLEDKKREMADQLSNWIQSCKRSDEGKDYGVLQNLEVKN